MPSRAPSRIVLCLGAMLGAGTALAQGYPSYEELKKAVRDAAEGGIEYSIRVPGKDAAAHIFYNNPKPFCFAYSIPGEWEYGEGPGSWRSRDGQQIVGVMPYLTQVFQRNRGETPVEKAAAAFVQDYEKQLNAKVTDATLTPFAERIWKWSAPPVKFKGRNVVLGTKYIIEVPPDGLLVLTVIGKDQEELARRVLTTVKTSTTPPCFLPVLDELIGIIAPPNRNLNQPTKPSSGMPQATGAGTQVYKNPAFPWTITYPDGWEFNLTSPGQLEILHPGTRDKASCSFTSAAVQFGSVDELADFWLTQAEQDMKRQGMSIRRGRRQRITLPNQVTGVSVTTEVVAAWRYHSVFVLSEGVGYMLDCATSVKNWGRLAPSFERIINSFTLEKKP